jgi:hypothetical protein
MLQQRVDPHPLRIGEAQRARHVVAKLTFPLLGQLPPTERRARHETSGMPRQQHQAVQGYAGQATRERYQQEDQHGHGASPAR